MKIDAREAGISLRQCPFPDGPAREQWLSDWNDAQIDREVWEDSNWHRAHSGSGTRPPSDRGQGRKPLSGSEKTVSKTFRMTEAQAAKVERLGGAQWLRERIDKAKEK